jgi:hypothetical protein
MVRNLGILKMRFSLPTRFDQYSIGPGEVSLTAKAVSSIGMARKINALKELIKSKKRFKSIPQLSIGMQR